MLTKVYGISARSLSAIKYWTIESKCCRTSIFDWRNPRYIGKQSKRESASDWRDRWHLNCAGAKYLKTHLDIKNISARCLTEFFPTFIVRLNALIRVWRCDNLQEKDRIICFIKNFLKFLPPSSWFSRHFVKITANCWNRHMIAYLVNCEQSWHSSS